ncbi:MAG: phasin family protein [Pseudomonadota bacterium]|nr:phasin family protein [Pseudomonadota bacterium]
MAKSNEMVSELYDKSRSFMNPVFKTNRLAVNELEKLVYFQLDALRNYVDLGMQRMKAAAEIDSVEDLQDFYKGQFEAATTLRQMLLDDAKSLANLAAGFQSDFNRLSQENAEEVGDKTVRAARSATDKAREATDKTVREAKDVADKAS